PRRPRALAMALRRYVAAGRGECGSGGASPVRATGHPLLAATHPRQVSRRRPSRAGGGASLAHVHKRVHRRLNNVASFEWSAVVERGLLSGRLRPGPKAIEGQASHFDAGLGAFADGLMWHWRSDSRITVDGGVHGPAHGSPPADRARIVRDNAV